MATNMNREQLPFVLCVDDEPRVVEGLALHLRRDYHVVTASGANGALQLLKAHGAPAVIVSDMRMPGMDGATLLKHVRHLYPETTRILLTGDPGRDVSRDACVERPIGAPRDVDEPAQASRGALAHPILVRPSPSRRVLTAGHSALRIE